MDPSEAEQTIVAVERVRRSTRHALNPIWYANIAFGLFFAGTALVALPEFGHAASITFWVAGGLLTMGLVVRHYARTERTVGVESPVADASTFILAGLIAGVVLANALTDGDANAVAPLYVGAAAAVALGQLLGDRIELAAGAAIALVATAVAAVSPSYPGVWGNLGLGVVLVVAGLLQKERA
jgi:hypothetical protein